MKIAFTGTHGCGKTTAVYNAAHQYKLKHNSTVNILTEVARFSPFPINRSSTIESQQWIFYTQIIKELEEQSKCDILICDRSVVDVLAYCKVLGFNNIVSLLTPLAKYHLRTYDQLYFLSIKNNDYLFSDGIRDLDLSFRQKVEDELLIFYSEFGKDIIDWGKNFIIQ